MITQQKIYDSKSDFQEKVSLKIRREKTDQTLSQNTSRIPVWLDFRGCASLRDILSNHKFLTPDHLTVADFISHLRTKNKLSSENAMFVFINNKLPRMTSTLSEIYSDEKDEDGMLYITVKEESVFG
jgi:hypothetical protein